MSGVGGTQRRLQDRLQALVTMVKSHLKKRGGRPGGHTYVLCVEANGSGSSDVGTLLFLFNLKSRDDVYIVVKDIPSKFVNKPIRMKRTGIR